RSLLSNCRKVIPRSSWQSTRGTNVADLQAAARVGRHGVVPTEGATVAHLHAAIRAQLTRQVIHWRKAASRLEDLDDLAAPTAWPSLERYMRLSIRHPLSRVVSQLVREGDLLQAALAAAVSPADLLRVRKQLLNFRKRYSRVEMTLFFFADAI